MSSKIRIYPGVYDEMCNEHLFEYSFKKTFIGNTNSSEANSFFRYYYENERKILEKLRNRTYKSGGYREFIIHEKKTRLIQCLSFKDRVVQHLLFEILYKYLDPTMINTTLANRKGKGIHMGKILEQHYINKMGKDSWVVKGDISKFFYSIDSDVLKALLERKIGDKDILNLCYMFIPNKIGIPIGNITSQLFANLYMGELDHYIKDDLGYKCYIRYMDDFVANVRNKQEAQELLKLIKEFVTEKLHLRLNAKTQIFPVKNGVNFLGGIIYKDYARLRRNTVRNIKRKIVNFSKISKDMNTQDRARYYNDKLYSALMSFLGLSKYYDCRVLEGTIYNAIKFCGIGNPEVKSIVNQYNLYNPKWKLKRDTLLNMIANNAIYAIQ